MSSLLEAEVVDVGSTAPGGGSRPRCAAGVVWCASPRSNPVLRGGLSRNSPPPSYRPPLPWRQASENLLYRLRLASLAEIPRRREPRGQEPLQFGLGHETPRADADHSELPPGDEPPASPRADRNLVGEYILEGKEALGGERSHTCCPLGQSSETGRPSSRSKSASRDGGSRRLPRARSEMKASEIFRSRARLLWLFPMNASHPASGLTGRLRRCPLGAHIIAAIYKSRLNTRQSTD
jgi:hypothetical protein